MHVLVVNAVNKSLCCLLISITSVCAVDPLCLEFCHLKKNQVCFSLFSPVRC